MHGSSHSLGEDPRPKPTAGSRSQALLDITSAMKSNLELPISTIHNHLREYAKTKSETLDQHFSNIISTCSDILCLNQRFVGFLHQLKQLPTPEPAQVRVDELLVQLDHELLPVALRRGVIWSYSAQGPLQHLYVDPRLCFDAIVEAARLAIDSAAPGDSVTVDVVQNRSSVFRLTTTALELIAGLEEFVEDPLFNSNDCLSVPGTDPGSRFALIQERVALVGGSLMLKTDPDGKIRTLTFTFREAQRVVPSSEADGAESTGK